MQSRYRKVMVFFHVVFAVSHGCASFRGFDWLSAEMGRSERHSLRTRMRGGSFWQYSSQSLTTCSISEHTVLSVAATLSLWISEMAAYKLVLIRHGESCWNQENRFCGWFDADLSETGAQEAKKGGQALKGLYNIIFSSVVHLPS